VTRTRRRDGSNCNLINSATVGSGARALSALSPDSTLRQRVGDNRSGPVSRSPQESWRNPTRAIGLVLTVTYAALIGWLYVRQPQTLAQVTGGLSDVVGAYTVNDEAFADGLRFFRNDRFVEARMAFAAPTPPCATRARSSTWRTATTGRAGPAVLRRPPVRRRAAGHRRASRSPWRAPGRRRSELQMQTAEELRRS